jgi:hypothetical protein
MNMRRVILPLICTVALLSYQVDAKAGLNDIYWTPSGVATAWYDAAEIGTLQTNQSGQVSQWSDKAGTNHLLQAAALRMPYVGNINGISAVDFRGAPAGSGDEDYLDFTYNLPMENSLVMFVWLPEDDTNSQQIINGHTDNIQIRYGYNDQQIQYVATAFNSDYGSTTIASSFTLPAGSAYMTGWQWGDTMYEYLNGVSNALANRVAYVYDFNVDKVGTYRGTAAYFDGHIGELVVTSDQSLETRQKLEGYLAWKWGLEGDLPDEHPYKTVPPGKPPAGTVIILR